MEEYRLALDMIRDISLAWALFRDFEGFIEGLAYLATPSFLSRLRGEHVEDSWATLKIYLLLGLCALTVYEVKVNFIPWALPSFAAYLDSL